MRKLAGLLLTVAACGAADLPLVDQHSPRAAIVLDSAAGPLARKAAELFQSRVERRTGARLEILRGTEAARLPQGTGRIVIAAPGGHDANGWLRAQGAAVPSESQLGDEGFWLHTAGRTLFVMAPEGRGLIYGAGKVLRTARYGPGSMAAAAPDGLDRPALSTRVLYLAIHCDNFYEIEEAPAIVPIVEDMALWGINGLSVWLDETQYNDPFDRNMDNAAVRHKWDKEKQVLQAAQELGLKPGYVLCANDLYKNQVRPDIQAQGTDSWNRAPLACPSTQGGRALILRNKMNLFQDMARAGIRLQNALIFPYDTGGCFCDRCRPWILTFLKLTEDVAAVIHRDHPGARVYITDWHCKDDEAKRITEFFNQRKPAWLAGMWKDDRHPINRFAALDPRYQTLTFMDITEIGGWGTAGANPFARRFRTLLGDMHRNRIGGYMDYSEGIYDDFNKAATAQLAWNPSAPIAEVAREYCNYFLDASVAGDFERMIGGMEDSWSGPFQPWWGVKFIASPDAARSLAGLAATTAKRLPERVRDSWRWQVLARRARIGELAAELRDEAVFRAAVEQRLSAGAGREALLRQVEEKQAQLNAYRAAVISLRNDVYREPATRYPAMIPDEKFMSDQLQVPARAWEGTLNALRAKLKLSSR